MAVNVGRLRPIGFAKRGAVPSIPIVSGTFIPPTLFPRYIPPWNWNPEQPALESVAHDGAPEIPSKAEKGPGSLNGKKLLLELEPTDVFGNLFMAAFGTDTVTGDGTATPHAHNFERLTAAQLLTYDFWDDGGTAPAGKQNGFAAMMCNFLELQMTKGDFAKVDTEWNGMFKVEDLALSPVVAPPTERPLHFAQTDVYIEDVQQGDVQVFTIKMMNQIVADHVLHSSTNFPLQMWAEQQAVDFNMETILTNVVEYNKWFADGETTVQYRKLGAKITAGETFTEAPLGPLPYSIEIQLPQAFYRTGEIQYETGVVRAILTGGGTKATGTIGSGGNAYSWTTARSAVIQFINGVVAAY